MTSARLAPELSATLTTDSCWIMATPPSAGAFEDLDHAPPLVLRQRPGLHDAHAVPGLRRVVLAVRLHALGARDHLAVQRVREATLDRHHDRLLHLVAHHDPNARLARAALRGTLGVHGLTHMP